MMAQNRQSQKDRIQADNDYLTNLQAKKEIEALQIHLSKIDSEKPDVIIGLLKELKK